MEQPIEFFRALPKIELHRHLEGSLRIRTLLEVARAMGITVPVGTGELSQLVQVQHNEPFTYVMDWVCESAHSAAADHVIRVGLIASVNRHESVELAEQVAWLAADRKSRNILGLDLAGNEAEFRAEPFVGVFREVTSNYQTGVVKSLEAHPLRKMITAGLNVTLGTDDPSISQITLTDEYNRACEELELSKTTLKERILAAASASFLPEAEREAVAGALRKELAL